MARCQCGGGECACVIQAGENTSVTGSGSTVNPIIVSAVTNCSEVRTCLAAGPGVTYNPSTGAIGADVSAAAGNNLIINDDGLFVPTGAATVSVGCGLRGDGSASAPVQVRSQSWPFSCELDTQGGGVYCDSAGVLRSDPPVRAAYTQTSMDQTYNDLAIPLSETDIASLTLTISNPDPCRAAFAMVFQEADVTVTLPASSGGMYGINGDDMWALQNRGSAAINDTHVQVSKMINRTVPAGGSVTQTLNVSMGRGFGGASYSSIRATLRSWLFSIP